MPVIECQTNEREDDILREPINNENKEEPAKDIDYLLEKIIGPAGLGQWIIFCAVVPVGIASGLPIMTHMFAAYEPRHRCFVRNCDSKHRENASTFLPDWTNFAIPSISNSKEMLKVDESYDSCSMYEPIDSGCNPHAFNKSSVIQCQDGYVYETVPFTETLTTEVNLVCSGGETRRRLLGLFMMLGLMVGSLIGGKLVDKYGRKWVMLASITVIIPTQLFGGYCQTYWGYAALRLVVCTAAPIVWIAGHLMALEIIGTSKRQLIVFAKEIVFPITNSFATLIYYFNTDWIMMHIWTGALSILAWPCFFWIPDSARWLALNGNKDKAEQLLCKLARMNGKTLSLDDRQEIKSVIENVKYISKGDNKTKEETEDLGIVDMFKGRYLKTTLIMLLNWGTVCLVSYTLLLNATKLYGDIFVNFILVNMAGDITGVLLVMVTLTYFSRKVNMAYVQLVIGVSCLVTGLIPKDANIAIIVFYVIGKCFSGMGFLLVWLITAELYPTNLRGQAVGICSTVSRLFGLASPFVAQLANYWKPLPMTLLGVLSILSAMSVYFLPDTKNQSLPQTMEDGMRINAVKAVET